MALILPVLGIIFIWDIVQGRIPNKLVFLGLALSFIVHGNSGMEPLIYSLVGCLVGFLAVLPFYSMGLRGGGVTVSNPLRGGSRGETVGEGGGERRPTRQALVSPSQSHRGSHQGFAAAAM